MAAIITLRQEVLIGAHQKANSLTVKKYFYDTTSGDKIVDFELLDGRKGFLPLQNIAGICELKENKK